MIRICQLVCIPWIPFVIMLKPNKMIILLSIMSTKQWSSREIFKEHEMRDLMSQMYMALTQAGENAKSLSTIDVEQIRKIIPVGNRQTKEATREFLRDLEYYKDISDSTEAFERNVLTPIKFSAQLILHMRDRSRATTDLQCWVIAKSYPTYDPLSRQDMVTVTTVCPKIKTTMSVRISKEQADTLDYKIYQFPNVQPIPLVNRMRSAARRDEKHSDTNLIGKMGDYDFLFADLDDLEYFKYSFEMRHYCEISPDQSSHKQMLGAVLVCSGELLGTSGDIAVIKNPITGNSEKFHVRNKYSPNLFDRVSSLEKKYVRVLCSVWYDSGTEDDDHPTLPEIYQIEEIGNEHQSVPTEYYENNNKIFDKMKHQAIMENIVGFVRIRGSVNKKDLEKKFDETDYNLEQIIKDANHLNSDGEYVVYLGESAPTNDKICDDFLQVIKRISSIRRQYASSSAPFVTPDDFLSEKNLSDANIARKRNVAETLLLAIDKMGKRRTPEELEDVSKLLEKSSDKSGLDIKKIVDFELPSDASPRSMKSYLKRHGLAIFPTKHHVIITKKGRDIASTATQERIVDIIKETSLEHASCLGRNLGSNNQDLIKMYDPENSGNFETIDTGFKKSVIPTQMLIKNLDNSDDVEPLFDSLSKFFWIQKNSERDAIRTNCRNWLKKIFLEKFAEKFYTAGNNFNMLDVDNFDNMDKAEIELGKTFESCGFVDSVEKNGQRRWLLTTEQRLLWLLAKNPEQLTEDDIIKMQETNAFSVNEGQKMLPAERKLELVTTLTKLLNEGKIIRKKNGKTVLNQIVF